MNSSSGSQLRSFLTDSKVSAGRFTYEVFTSPRTVPMKIFISAGSRFLEVSLNASGFFCSGVFVPPLSGGLQVKKIIPVKKRKRKFFKRLLHHFHRHVNVHQ